MTPMDIAKAISAVDAPSNTLAYGQLRDIRNQIYAAEIARMRKRARVTRRVLARRMGVTVEFLRNAEAGIQGISAALVSDVRGALRGRR